jgi:hypothetical protein
MKLSKNEQLLILLLFIIACIFFVGNICKSKNYTTQTNKYMIKQIQN